MTASPIASGTAQGAADTEVASRDTSPSGVLPLLLVIVGAVGLRLVTWSRATMMMNDGPDFLWQARRFLAGEPLDALAHPYHPLYGALTAAVAWITGGSASNAHLETAGLCVSLLGAVVLVVAAWGLARAAFPDMRGAPIAAALLAAVNVRAVTFSADIQSDGLFAGLVLLTLWALVDARHPARLVLAGLLAGLTYLTRPEGLFLLLPLGLWFLHAYGLRPSRAWRGAAAFGAALVLCVAPYVVSLHDITGTWGLSLKPSLQFAGLSDATEIHQAPADSPLGWPVVFRTQLIPVWADDLEIPTANAKTAHPPVIDGTAPGTGDPPSAAVTAGRITPSDGTEVQPVDWIERTPRERPGWGDAILEGLYDLVHALRLEMLLFVLPGLYALGRGRPLLCLGLATTITAWIGVSAWQLTVNDYLTNRHMMLPLAALIPVGGAGLVMLWKDGTLLRVAAVFALAIAILTATRSQRDHHEPRLEALAWVQANTRADQAFATQRRRDGWYAERTAISTKFPVDDGTFADTVREHDAPYLVFTLADLLEHAPHWLANGKVAEIARFGEGEDTVLVLEPRFDAGQG